MAHAGESLKSKHTLEAVGDRRITGALYSGHFGKDRK